MLADHNVGRQNTFIKYETPDGFVSLADIALTTFCALILLDERFSCSNAKIFLGFHEDGASSNCKNRYDVSDIVRIRATYFKTRTLSYFRAQQLSGHLCLNPRPSWLAA